MGWNWGEEQIKEDPGILARKSGIEVQTTLTHCDIWIQYCDTDKVILGWVLSVLAPEEA
jgi:hypothetical protein